jgi:hypothetical protein
LKIEAIPNAILRCHGTAPEKKMTTKQRQMPKTRATVLALLATAALSTPSWAEDGFVRAVITRGGLLIGFSGGNGKLSFHGRDYPLTITGLSLGASIGASTLILKGRARNLRAPGDIEGAFRTTSAGAGLIVGAAKLRLQNAQGVVLELSGAKVGAELSLAAGGVWIKLR